MQPDPTLPWWRQPTPELKLAALSTRPATAEPLAANADWKPRRTYVRKAISNRERYHLHKAASRDTPIR